MFRTWLLCHRWVTEWRLFLLWKAQYIWRLALLDKLRSLGLNDGGQITRIAIVDPNHCKPKWCAQECKKVSNLYIHDGRETECLNSHVLSWKWVSIDLWCYYWRYLFDLVGKLCIEVRSTDKIVFISELLCIRCGICVEKQVPYQFSKFLWFTEPIKSDVCLKPLLLLIYQQTWGRRSHIATLQTHSNSIAYLCLAQAKSLDSSEPTISGRAQLWKSFQESSNPTWVITMWENIFFSVSIFMRKGIVRTPLIGRKF